MRREQFGFLIAGDVIRTVMCFVDDHTATAVRTKAATGTTTATTTASGRPRFDGGGCRTGRCAGVARMVMDMMVVM